MRIFLLFIFILLIGRSSFSQWNSIREVSNNSSLVDLEVLNQDTVFVLGSVFDQGSFVLRSYDGGTDWDSTWFEGYDFTGIDFASVSDGYISSFHNSRVSILKTTDGGDNWFVSKDSIILAQLVPCDIEFYDVNVGVVSLPGWSAITIDGGFEWNQIQNHPLGGPPDIIIRDDLYIGIGGALLTYSVDSCVNFESVMLAYSGSHSSMDAREGILISTAIGSGGLALGFPNNSYGILTKSTFPFDSQSILYFSNVSRFYDVSIAPNDFSMVHGVVLENNGTLKFVKSSDDGTSWQYLNHEMFTYSNSSQIECVNDSVCFAISNLPGEIYRTTNGGGTSGEEVNQVILGLNDFISNDLTIELFPNPTSSHLTLTSPSLLPGTHITAYNLTGQQVFNSQLNQSHEQFTLDARQFGPAGLYLLHIQMPGQAAVVKKVVVQE
jgi:hypothetical protein